MAYWLRATHRGLAEVPLEALDRRAQLDMATRDAAKPVELLVRRGVQQELRRMCIEKDIHPADHLLQRGRAHRRVPALRGEDEQLDEPLEKQHAVGERERAKGLQQKDVVARRAEQLLEQLVPGGRRASRVSGLALPRPQGKAEEEQQLLLAEVGHVAHVQHEQL